MMQRWVICILGGPLLGYLQSEAEMAVYQNPGWQEFSTMPPGQYLLASLLLATPMVEIL